MVPTSVFWPDVHSHIALGTAGIVLPLRDPILLSKMTASSIWRKSSAKTGLPPAPVLTAMHLDLDHYPDSPARSIQFGARIGRRALIEHIRFRWSCDGARHHELAVYPWHSHTRPSTCSGDGVKSGSSGCA